MPKIVILSSSVRNDRKSHRVALFLQDFISNRKIADPEIADLMDYNFPIFSERLKYLDNPSEKLLDFAQKITTADGVIIVTPEYNGSFPAALKNVIDVLYDEWYRKPISIAAISSGPLAASQVVMQLAPIFWKIKATMVPLAFHVPFIDKAFDEDGKPLERENIEKRSEGFINELIKSMNANQ